MALVLAAAAAAAAIVGTFAATVSGDATDSWQSAVRTEVKRSTAALNDVSYLYLLEFPQAMRVEYGRLLTDAFQAAQEGQDKAVVQVLEIEAATQAQVVDLISANTPLAGDSAYRLPSGGLDLGQRLADLRSQLPEGPELLALDPQSLVAEGDRLAAKASLFAIALIPISLGAFLGILAQPLHRWRVRLLLGGLAALSGGSLMAVIVGVVA